MAAASIALFSNPAYDQVQITNRQGLPLGEVNVFAADGRVVYSEAKAQSDYLVLDVQHLAPGLYTVRSMADGRVQALRLVKD
ncbi:MAG: T9SS type A sorting domain-containing protein [Flavobacteriales bacterium]|nr:T9SS type A sorting domain-containing protein [Flavobacteriales bacterium]